MQPVIADITELVANPIRTGIQRFVRELIRHWPDPEGLRLARFDPAHGLVPLPEKVLPLLLEDDDETRRASPDEVRRRIADCGSEPGGGLPADAAVLVPELFYETGRCAWYTDLLRRQPDAARFIIYDFIPWLYPQRVVLPVTAPYMPYLRMVRDATFTAFISGRTRTDYASRIRRSAATDVGPVLPLGADGLPLARQTFDPGKRSYVTLGVINGNKNQDRVFAAFRQLWDEGFDGLLVMIGRVYDPKAEAWLQEARREPRFRHLVDASDEEVCAELRRARATIFVSDVEGFGLPPVESLYAGIPVIVTSGTPSIADLPANGQIRLAAAEVPSIAAAVCSLADDDAAGKLWHEAASLALPTWRDLACSTAAWIDEHPRQADLAPSTVEESLYAT